MSVNPSQVLRAPHTVAVAPTETTIESFTRLELRTASRVTVQVYNANALQTFAGIIYAKQTSMSEFAVYDDVTLASVGPLISKQVVIDTLGIDLLEFRGRQSGAGGDVQTGTTRVSNSP